MPGVWKLQYPGTDAAFSDASGVYLRAAPDVADYDIATDDTDSARADGSQVGQDFHGGRTIGLTFGVSGSTEDEMWDRYGALSEWWSADSIRNVPGALAELISDRGRSAFGRPRKIAPSAVNPEARMMTVEATFRQVDKIWWGAPDTLQVPFAMTQSGGLVSPLKSPLVARGYTSAQNTFTVDGDAATWPVITIRGPVLNPTVAVAGAFTFTAATSLKYDEWLTIDTRPGRQTVLRNGSQIASLTRTSSLLAAASIAPGSHTFTLSGSSSTGAPTAQISWRSAYTAP
ncbi:phage tail family protein [Curtobacterium sp. ISL-83]|uniref:phage tail family protein n=1 Tax=Curtobacterium sp. ISL-83 TaxID=2819145 RepID=UPI001BE6B1D1|nr:phage tail family protein [Curtobacterium sp. ISL-83]MBT2502974.1 phage tail family protein [Curtobacterium sp. ISL-83]